MPDLTTITNRLERARTSLLAAIAAVPAEKWREAPRPEAWSAAHVVAHLTMVERAITDGAMRMTQHEPLPVPFWKRVHAPLVLAEVRLFKRKTPLPLDAGMVGEKEPMLEALVAAREQTMVFLKQNGSRDLSAYCRAHPFFGMLNLYEWFEVMGRHELRHTKQIREIVEFFQK